MSQQASTPRREATETPRPIQRQEPITIRNNVAPDPIIPDDTNKTSVIDVPETEKVEGIYTAYFAKEEFSLETTEVAGAAHIAKQEEARTQSKFWKQ